MAASNSTLIHRLQQALNMKGCKILYSTSQFYSMAQNRPVTIYHIKRAIADESGKKTTSVELFKSASQIRVVLFLRDLWYEVNGWEIPQDNEFWNQHKNETIHNYEEEAKENMEQRDLQIR